MEKLTKKPTADFQHCFEIVPEANWLGQKEEPNREKSCKFCGVFESYKESDLPCTRVNDGNTLGYNGLLNVINYSPDFSHYRSLFSIPQASDISNQKIESDLSYYAFLKKEGKAPGR